MLHCCKMPIKDASAYPPDWPEISASVKWDRAGGKCECDGRCGDPKCHGLSHGRCNAEHGEPHPVNGKKTVLTCAHLNHNPESGNEDELAALCARCHLYYDRDHHAAQRRLTKAAKDAADRARVKQTTAVMQFQQECGL